MITKVEITKSVVNFVVGAGASKIVHAIVKNNVQPEKLTDTISVAAGSLVLGSLVADASKKHTSAKIDSVVAWWNEAKAKQAEKTEEK